MQEFAVGALGDRNLAAGEEFGPYKSQREAMLFAIDAAHKLDQDEPDRGAGAEKWWPIIKELGIKPE